MTSISDHTAAWDDFVAAAVKRGAASASARRFIVVTVATKVVDGWNVPTGAAPVIFKRSDSIDTAKAHARKSGTWAVVVDRTTGGRV